MAYYPKTIDPTPEHIRRECLKIQLGWSDVRRYQRLRGWGQPEMSLSDELYMRVRYTLHLSKNVVEYSE